MTTTDAELNIHAVYTPEQITRLAALQGVAEFVHVLSGTIGSGVLIDLAEYVIGDDEPFDPVAEAHKAMAALRSERGYDYNGYDNAVADWGHDEEGYDYSGPGAHEDGPLADWERELLDLETRVVGDITVSDLAGFLTLPKTAVLLDADGDTWHYDRYGWTYIGVDQGRNPGEIFLDLGDWRNEFDFIVTNPEVLS